MSTLKCFLIDCGGRNPHIRTTRCSAVCRARDAIRTLKYKLEDAEAELAATTAVLKRFPGVTFLHVYKGSRLVPHCSFRLPLGAEVGWDLGSEFVYVAPVDRWQWNDYEDRRLQDRQIGAWESEGGMAA